MSRPARRRLLILASVVGLVLAFLVEERYRGLAGLRAWERDMRARGEKFTLAELVPPLPTNSAVRIVSPDQFSSLLAAANMPPTWPGAMRTVGPGKARPLWTASDWIDHDSRSNSWAQLESAFASLEEQLPPIRILLTNRSIFVRLDYDSGFDVPLTHLGRCKAITQALNAAAVHALYHHRNDEALENLTAAFGLLELTQDEGWMITQLVRLACAAILQTGSWEALQSDDWTDAQLAVFQGVWERQAFLLPMAHALALERATAARYYDPSRVSLRELVDATGTFNSVFGTSGSSDVAPGSLASFFEPVIHAGAAFRRAFHVYLWRVAWIHQDHLNHNRILQACVDSTRQAAANRQWPEPPQASADLSNADDPRDEPGIYDRLRHWLSAMILPACEKAVSKAVRLEVTRELTVAAIALKRHQLRHHTLPPSLDALVPEFLAAPPRDWYAGQPLGYRPNPDGSYLLYSIGDDGVDDHGDARNTQGEIRSAFYGRDMVWPQRATPQEIEAYKAGLTTTRKRQRSP
ncbi:MAG TPA: hypothetical protein PKM73_11470 [Verrucomicrobiota bacterium]|nr:hypothetical protein [Verrucomicrobiota bacterium]HNU49279.1 hypothetical protein [Verrucomicrobiota bacterium]